MHRAATAALLALSGFSCVRDNPDLVACSKSADCPLGLFCRDAQCTVPDGDRMTPPPRDAGDGDGDAVRNRPDGGGPGGDGGPVDDGCTALCERLTECVVGPDCPLLGPEAARLINQNCRSTCRDSTAFAEAVRDQADCAESVDWLVRGAEDFADACLGEGPPDACADGLQPDVVCDRRLDCCDRGLVCADLGEGSRCQIACDTNRDPNGCPPRAFCSPFEEVPAGQPRPGVCFPGDDCVPGVEAMVCEGPSTCLAVPPASFCLRAGDAVQDSACTQRSDRTIDNCRPGLVCAYARCRPPCDDRGHCETGECIDYSERLDGLPFRFCHEGCDIYRQRGCEDQRVCEVVDSDGDRRAVGACRPGDPGDGRQGDRCRSLEGRYWGNCHPGHLCGRLASDRGEQCIGLCDPSDSRLCTGHSLCVFGVLDLDLGVCLGECDVFEGAQCGVGRTCLFIAVGSEQNGQQGPVGQCTAGGGQRQTGQTCTRIPESGGHDCAAGHVCSPGDDGALRCRRICDPQHRCPAGKVCNPVFGGGIGICD